MSPSHWDASMSNPEVPDLYTMVWNAVNLWGWGRAGSDSPTVIVPLLRQRVFFKGTGGGYHWPSGGNGGQRSPLGSSPLHQTACCCDYAPLLGLQLQTKSGSQSHWGGGGGSLPAPSGWPALPHRYLKKNLWRNGCKIILGLLLLSPLQPLPLKGS